MDILTGSQVRAYQPWMPIEDGVDEARRAAVVASLSAMGEHYASGFLEEGGASLFRRAGLALLRAAERNPLPRWNGSTLYPATQRPSGEPEPTYVSSLWSGAAGDPPCFTYHHSYPLCFSPRCCGEKREKADPAGRYALDCLSGFMRTMPSAGGYTHCTVNHERVLREGLSGTEKRLRGLLAEDCPEEKRAFWESLLLTIEAARVFQRRLIEMLEGHEPGAGEEQDRRIRLIRALSRVPMEPPRDFFEAFVCVNFIYYFEGCDSPGRLDQYLLPFYEADRAALRIDDAEVVAILQDFWRSMNATTGWNVAIGGTKGPDGRSAVNPLTYLCIEAVKGMRRPNLALRIPGGAPDALWDKAFESLATGAGLPALYNNDLYVEALRDYRLGLSETDVHEISFGGCTETMIQGCSNVGSLAGNLHLLQVLERTIQRRLVSCGSFGEFLGRFEEDLADEIAVLCDHVRDHSEMKARFQPHLVRSLLVEDCVSAGREFAAGGARYNWEVVCLEGFANVVDSLYTIRRLVFEEDKIGARKMLDILAANFSGFDAVLAEIRRLPKYGQGVAEVDELARTVADFAFRRLHEQSGWRGGRFLGSCLMFVTYAWRGKPIGATPDGRLAGEPLADSFGAYQGRDSRGPTAMLSSITSFAHKMAPGTLVINMRVARELVSDPHLKPKLRALLKSYFDHGGMQIQINVVDQETLRDAIAHPERHGDLIVRIGGYSEYFNILGDDLKQTVLERCVHA